ncbi:hypothetical protein [Dielma fastidiosa]|uniref:hypothetical protein n=1 Tax=Dielma fastidiosa TaxID=1034346 RepID=UPI0035623913
MCVKERLSKRELERQIDSSYFERYMLSQKTLTPAIAESKRGTGNVFLDNYVLDFLMCRKLFLNVIYRNLLYEI